MILTVFSSCTTWLQGTAGACIAIFSSVGWRCTEGQLEIQQPILLDDFVICKLPLDNKEEWGLLWQTSVVFSLVLPLSFLLGLLTLLSLSLSCHVRCSSHLEISKQEEQSQV